MEVLTDFSRRHLGPRPADIAKMLAEVGAGSIEELIAETVPGPIRIADELSLPPALTEPEALAEMRRLADSNQVFTQMIGLGYYDTYTPSVILRNVLENPAWYTAYTPYQPEISQGRLEVLLTFQTMVTDLCGLEVANASLLDEGTAAAEAMTMCRRLAKGDRKVFWIDRSCHPQTIAVVATRAEPVGIEVRIAEPVEFDFADAFGALIAYPASSGALVDHRSVIEAAHDADSLVAVVTDLLALTLLVPPGELGADIAVGSSQRFGVPMGFGGPHAAFIATRQAMVRALPGRLVGVSKDSAGRTAFRLALQTREQHIRREKATSNVCTAQVLLAVMAALYACWHGPEGLTAIARRVNHLTGRMAASLVEAGLAIESETWFDTLTVSAPGQAREMVEAARARRINLRWVDEDRFGISFDETSTEDHLQLLAEAFGIALTEATAAGIPPPLARHGEFLTHEVFDRYRSEHEMLRYLRRLADKDLALDRTMIPLGSCTMKLNAATEMIPISLEGFARIHPFAPREQTEGYRELIENLASYLEAITGYDRVSLQPNAGSQGELAGLLAIRGYHRSRGDEGRDLCLIPSSAHGTNAASAVMAGMEVMVVACDDEGNVDLSDLEAKCAAHADRLSAVMVTYPSTHGVFEEGIRGLCETVHRYGGQVYVDGANLNAMVGLAQPGEFGADVSHLNLHKTFTIPHGGGGPGVGPIGVRAHLAPFLPSHPLVAVSPPSGGRADEAGKGVVPDAGPESGVRAISSAPWGSAGILPIPYVYIRMMGAAGLKRASEVAIIGANYLATRLESIFPVLYRGAGGRVAHECILDLRPLQRTTGIGAEDVAKRLADYGFHAPTLSFPVAGTLMVEPTESESLAELDRFCEAMIGIREEIARVESGEWSEEESPLRRAPHTSVDVATDSWDRAYSRDLAAFPAEGLRLNKYWPPVSRIDGAGGDRNLICACPPLEDYAP